MLLIFCKVLEKCIHSRVTDFIIKHRILSPNQFGFQKGLSTENAVSAFCEFIYTALNEKKITFNIFIDLQKAYETINRDILLKKLTFYGIRGLPLKLFSDYLSARTQVVRLGSCLSQSKEITTGLPTGSVLSCILFLLYINDLPHISPHITPFLFADDTTLSFSGSSVNELTLTCNSELEKFLTWTQANRLAINTGKTFQINIATRCFTPPNLYLNNTLITTKSNGKFLGIFIDDKMRFKSHIDFICTKISKSIGILYHLKGYLPTPSLISLYYSIVYPYLIYCTSIWGGTYTSYLKPLEVLQKRCIRLVTNSPYLAHTDPLFKRNGLLKLSDIYKFKIATYAYKNRNSIQSDYLRPHDHNTRFRSDLLPHYERLATTSQSLHYVLPNIWNTIPTDIKNSESVFIFKRNYKRFLISFY